MIKFGVLGGADVAFRRFIPALRLCDKAEYVGVGTRSVWKANSFREAFGGKCYDSYEELLADHEVRAVYVALPPALHYQWGIKVLNAGKHVFMEKPFTVSASLTDELLCLAAEKGLVVHENYMFLYHSQLQKIRELLAEGVVGELRLVRISFGFPPRPENDIRYSRELGGGAALDCGGYAVRLSRELLGESTKVCQAKLVRPEGFEVDIYGSAVLTNRDGLCAQTAFGMDNSYRCELEVWGSSGVLRAPRIFTAPPDFSPVVYINDSPMTLPPDNAFLRSIESFIYSVQTGCTIENEAIRQQAVLMDNILSTG